MFRLIFDWSEVWALFIPLFSWAFSKKQPSFMTPVSVYLCIALLINLCGDIISDFYKHFPVWLRNNTYLYNFHSILRFVCFSWFFILLKRKFLTSAVKILALLYFSFVLINFIFIEPFVNPNRVSGNLLTVEAYFLLVYCILYYLSQLIADAGDLKNDKTFWVTTGLSIYVVTNFFVFLFYDPMMTQNSVLANNTWDIHNVAYITLAICLAKAYHVPVRPHN